MELYMERKFWENQVNLDDKNFGNLNIENLEGKPVLNDFAFKMLFEEILRSSPVEINKNAKIEYAGYPLDNGYYFTYQDLDHKIGTFYMSFNAITTNGNVKKKKLFKDNIRFIFKKMEKEGYYYADDEISHELILSDFWLLSDPELCRIIDSFKAYMDDVKEKKVLNFIEKNTTPSMVRKLLKQLNSQEGYTDIIKEEMKKLG